jgi:hypothetical protein
MNRLKPTHILICTGALLTFLVRTEAATGLTKDEMTLLQDTGGWEYISLSDSDNGVQTTHTCFDGTPHPDGCSGTLRLSADNTFLQSVHIHGQSVQRHGTYQLDGNQIAFFDEFGTKDGPYTLQLNAQAKSLVLQMPQIRIQLELEKEYRNAQKKPKS